LAEQEQRERELLKLLSAGYTDAAGSPNAPADVGRDALRSVVVRVLLTEDDGDLRLAVSTSLRGAGLAVDNRGRPAAADLALAVNSYDCAVFDRMLPAADAVTSVPGGPTTDG
jgi:hypothetical protein